MTLFTMFKRSFLFLGSFSLLLFAFSLITDIASAQQPSWRQLLDKKQCNGPTCLIAAEWRSWNSADIFNLSTVQENFHATLNMHVFLNQGGVTGVNGGTANSMSPGENFTIPINAGGEVAGYAARFWDTPPITFRAGGEVDVDISGMEGSCDAMRARGTAIVGPVNNQCASGLSSYPNMTGEWQDEWKVQIDNNNNGQYIDAPQIACQTNANGRTATCNVPSTVTQGRIKVTLKRNVDNFYWNRPDAYLNWLKAAVDSNYNGWSIYQDLPTVSVIRQDKSVLAAQHHAVQTQWGGIYAGLYQNPFPASMEHSAYITITPPAPTLTFTANPTSVPYGGSSQLRWTSINATSCVASAPGGNDPAWNGSKAVGPSRTQNVTNLQSNKTYFLACSGPGGSVFRSVTIQVASPPPPPEPEPELAITKEHVSSTPEEMRFRVTVQNTGTVTAQSVAVNDVLLNTAAEVAFTNLPSECTQVTGFGIHCTIGTLTAGQERILNITLDTSQAQCERGVTNHAVAMIGNTQVANATAPRETIPCKDIIATDLTCSPQEIVFTEPGSSTFTVNLSTLAGEALAGKTVYVALDPPGLGSVQPSTRQTNQAGDAQFTYTIPANMQGDATQKWVRIGFAGDDSALTQHLAAFCDIRMQYIPPDPDDEEPQLEIIKTHTSTTRDTMSFTVTAKNTGAVDAHDVIIVDHITTTHPTWQNITFSTPLPEGCVLATGRTLHCYLNTLAAGQERSLAVNINTANTQCGVGGVNNRARIYADGLSGSLVSEIGPYDIECAPELSVSKTNNAETAAPGDSLTYDITLSNTTRDPATDAFLVDLLPQHTTFVSASNNGVAGTTTQSSYSSYDWGGRQERWILYTFGGQEQWLFVEPNDNVFLWNNSPRSNLSGVLIGTVEGAYSSIHTLREHTPVRWSNLSLSAHQTISRTVTASVSSDTPDNTTLRNLVVASNGSRDTDDTTVEREPDENLPSLTISKQLHPDTFRDVMYFNITVTNNSIQTMNNVEVGDSLSAGQRFASFPPECSNPPHGLSNLRCDLGSMAPNQTKTIKIGINTATQQCRTGIQNYARVTANNSSTIIDSITVGPYLIPCECEDGVDNDGDGVADQDDPGCYDDDGNYEPDWDDESRTRTPATSPGVQPVPFGPGRFEEVE